MFISFCLFILALNTHTLIINLCFRIHYEILAQFVDPSSLTTAAAVSVSGSSGGYGVDSSMYQLSSLSLTGGGSSGGYTAHHQQQLSGVAAAGSGSSHTGVSLDFSTLGTFGLQAETVRQLR